MFDLFIEILSAPSYGHTDYYSAFIGSIVSAGIGYLGARRQEKAAKSSARAQMDFQREMSNTSYQRGMEDMRKAGLNPILAYKQGGASVPSGSQYNPPDVGKATLAGAASAATISNLRAQNNNLHQQNYNLKATERHTQEQSRRLALENSAYAELSPRERLLYLSANPAASAVSAAKNLGGVASSVGKRVGSAVSNSARSVGSSVRNIGRGYRSSFSKLWNKFK